MREKEVVKLLKDHVKKNYNDDWEFAYGREKIKKKKFLERLDNDKKFRKVVVKLLDGLTVDILTRKGVGE